MNFGRLKSELTLAVEDHADYAGQWINDAVLEIASDFDLPDLKLKTPATLTTTNSDWLYDMPATYHKKAFKCRNSLGYTLTVKTDIQDIENLDWEHTSSGDDVTTIAIEDGKIAVYPIATDTLYLWYFRKPVDMVNDSDVPDGIPAAYVERVILSKVMVKNYRLLTDMAINNPHQSIQYWDNRYREALYGIPGGDIGMINYLAKIKGVKVGGGSRGRYI